MNNRLSILSKYSPWLIPIAVAVVIGPWPWWNGEGSSEMYWYLYDITRAAFIFLLSWCWFASVEWKFQRLRFILMVNGCGWTFFLAKQVFTPGISWQTADTIGAIILAFVLLFYMVAHTRFHRFEPGFKQLPKPYFWETEYKGQKAK